MTRTRWFVGVVALTAVGVIAGCGDDTASSSQELTKAQFIKQANAICAKKGAQITVDASRLIRAGDARRSDTQARIIDQIIVPNLETEIKELGQLEGPAGDQQQIDRILAAIQQTADRLSSASPITAASSFKEAHPYRPGEELAAEYGLTACGHP